MAVNGIEAERQQELATFLRSRRARLAPETVGLPRGTRRRTPGLRREEVALLAGVSPEWYTWLEQGRGITVSTQVLESLARVLQLDGTEREHLFLLALRLSPPVETFSVPSVSATLQQFLDQLGTTPACATDQRLNIVAYNAAHRAVFGTYDSASERGRNLIWRLFTSPSLPKGSEAWQEIARIYLAQFRAGYGRFVNDPWWSRQIAALSESSQEFQTLWARHDVSTVSEGSKVMDHAQVGTLHFNFLWLQTVDSEELKLLIHTPRSHSGTAEKIEHLLADTLVARG